MGFTITPGRTWITGETVTAAKLNSFLTGAFADSSSYQDAGGTFNASNGDHVWIGESDTVNLPTSPNDNDEVNIAQLDGDLTSNSATVDADTINIDYNGFNGAAAGTTLTLDRNFIGNLKFVYNSANNQWKLT